MNEEIIPCCLVSTILVYIEKESEREIYQWFPTLVRHMGSQEIAMHLYSLGH